MLHRQKKGNLEYDEPLAFGWPAPHCSRQRLREAKSTMPELKTEVGQLNQKLQRLTDLAVALEQQTTLNRQSTNGVYLLPAAKSPALLKSDLGELTVTLLRVAPDASGLQAVLEVKNNAGQPLPPFTASLSWGQLDPVTGKPLTVDMQTQTSPSNRICYRGR